MSKRTGQQGSQRKIQPPSQNRGRPGGASPPGASQSARERAKVAAQQAQRRRERRILLIAGLVLVLVVVGGGIGFQAWRTMSAPKADGSAKSVTFAPVKIEPGKPIVLGAADAPVTISLFEDFHCPHCADFEQEFGPVITDAQKSGKAKVELFTMAFIDQGSVSAANAMACAAEAGFGESYYQGLFQNHTLQWSNQQLLDLAGKVGAKATPEFSSCVSGQQHADWVQSIGEVATKRKVTSTPTVFINSVEVPLQGLTPDSLRAKIDKAA